MKTVRVEMLQTESGRHPWFPTGGYHCLLGHKYDVPKPLADAWLAADPPVAKKVPKRKAKKADKE